MPPAAARSRIAKDVGSSHWSPKAMGPSRGRRRGRRVRPSWTWRMGPESKGDVRAEQEAYRTGHMRRAVLVAAVVLASSVAFAPRGEAADDAKPLLGRWESVTRSAGGLGQIMELR